KRRITYIKTNNSPRYFTKSRDVKIYNLISAIKRRSGRKWFEISKVSTTHKRPNRASCGWWKDENREKGFELFLKIIRAILMRGGFFISNLYVIFTCYENQREISEVERQGVFVQIADEKCIWLDGIGGPDCSEKAG